MGHARGLLTAILSVSLVAGSTAAAASSAPLPRSAQPDAWMTLSMLTPTGATALAATGAAAGQADAALPPPPPPPPPPEYRGNSDTTWMLIGSSIVLLALLALAVDRGDHHDEANSPD